MGLLPKVILDEALAPGNGGRVSKSEFFPFWQQLQSRTSSDQPDECTAFMERILGQLSAVLTQPESKSSSGSSAASSGSSSASGSGSSSSASGSSSSSAQGGASGTVPLNALVNTIAYATWMLPYSCEKIRPIAQALTEKTELYRDHPPVRDVLRLLNTRLHADSGDADDSTDPIGSLVINASTLHTLRDLQMLSVASVVYGQPGAGAQGGGSGSSAVVSANSAISSIIGSSVSGPIAGYVTGGARHVPAFDDMDVRSNEFGFVYTYLLTLARSSERGVVDVQMHILQTLLAKTLTLPQQMKLSPPVAESSMLAMMHMARQILAVDYVHNQAQLKRFISTIQPLYLWPLPYGHVAKATMEALQAECLSPGCNHLAQLDREALVVDYTGIEMVPGYRYTKPLFYLVDPASANSSALTVIDPAPFDEGSLVAPTPLPADPSGGMALPPPIQALCVLAAIVPDENTEMPPAPTVEWIDIARRIDPPTMAHYLEEVRAVAKQTANNPDLTREMRLQALARIRASLLAYAEKHGQRILTTNSGCDVSDLVVTYAPPLPALEHVRVNVSLRRGLREIRAIDRLTMGEPEKGPYYPASGLVETMHMILKKYAADASQPAPKHPREVRFAVTGNDATLHHTAAAYVLLRQKNPEVFHGLRLRFYVLPTSRNNSLAGYIARHDPWYYRHIFTPFRSSPLLVPWPREDDGSTEGKVSDSTALSPPTLFLRECVAQYVREGLVTVPCQMYQLEGWTESKAETETRDPDEIIPFLLRVEIGLPVAAEEFRLRTNRPGLRMDELTKDKGFLFQSQDLAVRLLTTDLSGTARRELTEECLPFISFTFSSVPRKQDMGHIASPTEPTIESYCQLLRPDKLRKSPLVLDPRQHVLEAQVSVPPVSAASTTGGSIGKFRVLVDGMLYGPYSSIRITKALDHTKRSIVFPVQAFFPFETQ